jgi:general secretion pathway protein D
MNYENLDIRVLARIVSELTGRNLVLDDQVQGKVTLLASSQMSSDELWQVFEGVLNKNGFGLRQRGDIYQIGPLPDVRREARNGSMVLVMREGDANQVLTAIRPLLSDPNSAQVYGPGKSLVLVDTPAVLRQVVSLVRSLDRATPQVRVDTVFLQYAEAEKMAPLLQNVLVRANLLPGQSNPVVVSFPPTNALLVQAHPEILKEVRKTVAALDVPKAAPLSVEKPRYFVYKLQQGKAEDVAKIVQDLLNERKRAQQEDEARRGRQATNQVPPGAALNPPGPAVNGSFPAPAAPPTQPSPAAGAPAETAQQVAYVGARVGADADINAVLVYVSPSEYPSIRSLLGHLDRARKQVLVHVMVAEVSLTRLLETGARLQLFDTTGPIAGFNGGASEEGLLSFLTSGQFLIGATGPSNRTINVGGRDVQVPGFFAFLSANKQSRDFELISSPRLVATDHKKAEMKVGNVVPFATGARFSQIGQPVITYDYKDVGIKLEITPHVSQSKVIRLELDQEVQEVTEFLQQNLGAFGYVVPLISNRRVKTDVNLREGETLLIGGLISRRTTETIKKTPILGDIPLIQNLFRELRKEERKTSLFVALTPYLIESPEDIGRIDQAYQQFLSQENLPSQAQWEPRETRPGGQAVGDPYSAQAVDPQPFVEMSAVALAPPSGQDRLRAPRLLIKNRDPQIEAELEVHLRITRPDKVIEEMVGSQLRLGPGESREVQLSPYSFPDLSGQYQFEAKAYVKDRRVGESSQPFLIDVP